MTDNKNECRTDVFPGCEALSDSKSVFTSFRVDTHLAELIESAVFNSGVTKTAWLIDAVKVKLGKDTNEGRLSAVLEKLEAVAGGLLDATNQRESQLPEEIRQWLDYSNISPASRLVFQRIFSEVLRSQLNQQRPD